MILKIQGDFNRINLHSVSYCQQKYIILADQQWAHLDAI